MYYIRSLMCVYFCGGPDRNLEVFHHYSPYEGLRLLPSVCEQIIIQQTLIIGKGSLDKHWGILISISL